MNDDDDLPNHSHEGNWARQDGSEFTIQWFATFTAGNGWFWYPADREADSELRGRGPFETSKAAYDAGLDKETI